MPTGEIHRQKRLANPQSIPMAPYVRAPRQGASRSFPYTTVYTYVSFPI